MKKNKLELKTYVGLGLVVVLLLGLAVTANAGISFKELVAKYVAPMAYQDIKDDIDAEVILSAMSGPDVYQDMFFHNTVQTGGGCFATSTTNASETILAKDMRDNNCFIISGENDGMTLTLPATSTMHSMLKDVGDERTWLIHFATTTSATLTIVEGLGMDLIGPSANDDVIDEAETARLQCIRYYSTGALTDITCIIEELTTVD